MIKDTSSKNNRPKNRLQSLKSEGFIQLFAIIVVLALILIYFGLEPKGVWENIIKPIIEWFFGIILKIIELFIDIAMWLIEKIKSIVGL